MKTERDIKHEDIYELKVDKEGNIELTNGFKQFTSRTQLKKYAKIVKAQIESLQNSIKGYELEYTSEAFEQQKEEYKNQIIELEKQEQEMKDLYNLSVNEQVEEFFFKEVTEIQAMIETVKKNIEVIEKNGEDKFKEAFEKRIKEMVAPFKKQLTRDTDILSKYESILERTKQ